MATKTKEAPGKKGASKPAQSTSVAVVTRKPATSSRPVALTPEERVARRAKIITEEASSIASQLTALQTVDVSIEKSAVDFRREVVKPGKEEALSYFDPIVKKQKAAYDEARDQRDRALESFETADKLILGALNGYESLKKRLWREEQEKAQKEQLEKESQAAIQRAQERKRVEEEIDRKLEELPVDATEEEIEAIKAPLYEYKETFVTAPPIQVSQPEGSGSVVQVDNWRAEVEDTTEILKQIVAGTLPISLVEMRQPEMNKLAKLYKSTRSFAGMRFVNTPFVRGTGR